jgi:AcrR family transcriptional regulator
MYDERQIHAEREPGFFWRSEQVSSRPIPPDPKRRSWRSKKASTTRFRLLEATLDCLVELGYANTSIKTIAERAGVSRGAVQFHFPTKLSAMEAVIQHLLQRRLDKYRSEMARIPAEDDFLTHAIRAYWKQVTDPEFTAQQELALAGRTEPEIARCLSRAYHEYVTQSRAPFLEEFPDWKASGQQYELAANFAQYLIEGMAWGYSNRYLTDEAVESALSALRTTVAMLLDEPPEPPANSQAREPQRKKGLRRPPGGSRRVPPSAPPTDGSQAAGKRGRPGRAAPPRRQ